MAASTREARSRGLIVDLGGDCVSVTQWLVVAPNRGPETPDFDEKQDLRPLSRLHFREKSHSNLTISGGANFSHILKSTSTSTSTTTTDTRRDAPRPWHEISLLAPRPRLRLSAAGQPNPSRPSRVRARFSPGHERGAVPGALRVRPRRLLLVSAQDWQK